MILSYGSPCGCGLMFGLLLWHFTHYWHCLSLSACSIYLERDVNINCYNVIKMWGKKYMHPISYICIMCSIYVNLPLVFYMFSFSFFFFNLLNVLSYLSFSLEICSLLDEKYDLRKMRHFQYFQEGPDPCVSSSLCQKVVWRSRKR